MKKKNGFTLIELIAVLALIALLALLISNSIASINSKNKQKDKDEFNRKVENAACTYIDLSEVNFYCQKPACAVDVDLLIENGLLSEKEYRSIKGQNKQVLVQYEIVPEGVEKTCTYTGKDVIVPSYIYGIKRSLNTSSTAWERIEASKDLNLVANAQIGTTLVRNDFDNLYPWSDIKTYDYDTVTGEKIWFGEPGFSYKPTGNKEVLTYIPAFYYKREQKDGYEYIYISATEVDGFVKSEAFSVGRYPINLENNKAHSKSGTNPATYYTITEFRNYARNLNKVGSNMFGIMDYHYFILQLLYLVEYADYDSQTKLGPGYVELGYYNTDEHAEPIVSGTADFLGMKSGNVDGTKDSVVIYRGIESIFGNVWQLIDGINILDYQAYVCYNQAEYQTMTYTGCYQPIGYENLSRSGYIRKLGYDANNPLIAFPIEQTYSDGYIPNYYFPGDDTAPHNQYFVLIGGGYQGANTKGVGTGAKKVGMWTIFTHLNSTSEYNSKHSDIGSRLIKLEN